ncbi:phosphatase PAP2 family protein [Shewanella sp. KT0246]|uniref:phosphatase PAP2 family protein n=1 Tax=Shewanella sp. KT0246 TaxID=2815912 RepID=UPI001BC7D0F8|nr:phosphatase PAP2 family protein [Shewanella sp. KT0246]GIU53173.1 PAP2 family phosphoesterase [Shewanella sp. KT0246]
MKKLLLALPLLFSVNANAESIHSDLRTYGDVAQVAIPLTGFFVAWMKDDTEGMWQLGKTVVYTQAITEATKYVTDVTRPCGGERSFPSGHTSAAFSGAAFLDHRYGFKYGLPAYIAATGVAYSRVKANKHWNTDVIAGACLAYTVSYFVTSRYRDPNLTIAPVLIGKDAQGIKISYTF